MFFYPHQSQLQGNKNGETKKRKKVHVSSLIDGTWKNSYFSEGIVNVFIVLENFHTDKYSGCYVENDLVLFGVPLSLKI